MSTPVFISAFASTGNRALVGVYHTRNGSSGNFVAILTPANGTRRKVAFLAAESGGAGFTVLGKLQGKLVWARCMECDDVSYILWSGHRYILHDDPGDADKRER
jgi:hypothetical protein